MRSDELPQIFDVMSSEWTLYPRRNRAMTSLEFYNFLVKNFFAHLSFFVKVMEVGAEITPEDFGEIMVIDAE